MRQYDELAKLFAQKKISRRDFLVAISVLGISVPLFGNASAGTERSTPQPGGRFRVGMGGGHTTDSLDPLQLVDPMAVFVGFGQLYNCLIEIDANNQLIPELAESWEVTPDAKIWTFRLRDGVEFHHGKTLTVEDVIFSLNRHRGSNSTSPAKSLLDDVVDIQTDGARHIKFTLTSGNLDFPYLLSERYLAIIPAETDNPARGIGTGGYILREFNPAERAFTQRNPNYWKQDRAFFAEVETIHIPDATSRLASLLSGNIDYMSMVDAKQASLLERRADLKLVRKTGGFHVTLPMLTDVEPYNSNDVRLALKYAVDRESMVQQFLSGYGSVGNDHPISPTMRYHASDLEQRVYDPDRAQYHLKRAGLGNYVFKLHTADTIDGLKFIDIAVLYKEHASNAGISIDVVQEPGDDYFNQVRLKKPWVISDWWGRPVEDLMLTIAYAANAPQNETRWRNKRFNTLLKASRTEFDEESRRAMYYEMQAIIRDKGGAVIPFFLDNIDAARTYVQAGDVATNYRTLDGFKAAERSWFDHQIG